jgi:hypothetical protein
MLTEVPALDAEVEAFVQCRPDVSALVRRFPGIRLASDQVSWHPNTTFLSLQALPVVLGPDQTAV